MKTDDKLYELRKKAEALLGKNNKQTQNYIQDIEKLAEELNIYQIELEMQNKELQSANEMLSKERQKYRELYMEAPVAYFTLNKTGNILDINYAAADMLGLPGEQYKYTSIFPYLEEHSKIKFTQFFKQIFESKRIEYGNITFINAQKQPVYTNLNAIAYYDTEVDDFLIRCSVSDQTQIRAYKRKTDISFTSNKILKRYQAIYAVAGAGIAIKSPEGTLIECNPAMAHMLGYTPEELVGKSSEQITLPEDADKLFNTIAKISKNKTTGRFEKRYITKNNKVVTADVSISAVYEDNEPAYLVVFAVNISKRKKAEEELRKSQELLDLFFHESHEGFFFMMLDEPVIWNNSVDKEKVLDYVFSHQRITKINDAMLEQYRAAREDFIGLTPNNLFEHDIEHGKTVWRKFFDEGKLDIDTQEKRFDGNDMTVTGSYICLYDRAGNITGHFGVQRDVTAQRQAEQQLKEREEKYRLLADNMLDMVALHQADGSYTYLSPSVNQILGYSHKTLIGKKLQDFVHPDDTQVINDFFKSPQAEKSETFSILVRVKNKAGEYLWFDTKIKPIRVKGIISHWQSVSRDISLLKRTKEDLLQFRIAVDNSSEQVFIFNLENLQFIDVNEAACKDLKYSREELLNMSADSIKPLYSAEKLKAELQAVSKCKEKAGTIETIHQAKDGTNIPVEVRIKTFELAGNQLVVAVARDISERKQAEQKMKQLVKQLKTSNAEKDKFFSIIAHDLRSPFNTILGFSSLLATKADGYDTDKIKKIATALQDTAKNTFALTENLLEWARSQRGKAPFNPEMNKLKNIIAETVPIYAEQAEEKDIVLEVNISQEYEFVSDKNMLSAIIRNLVSNAVKYTNNGGTITVSANQNGSNLDITVEDNGTGMDEATKNALFSVGETLSRPGTHGEKGTGFGLLICKEFVQKHKGNIRVESTAGIGSKFTVSLPYTKADCNK